MRERTSPLTPLLGGGGNAQVSRGSPPPPVRRGAGGEVFLRDVDMTKRARALRTNMTDAERRLWAAIRRDQLGVRFRRQLVFDQKYILDFYAPSIRLAIEVDGSQHVEHGEADRIRTSYLMKRGVSVLRFWNNEILVEFDAVRQSIADLVVAMQETSPLSPLLEGYKIHTSHDAR